MTLYEDIDMRIHEGQARSIDVEEFQRVIDSINRDSRYPERDCAILYISYYAGLRACEIAGLNWEDIIDNLGEIKRTITLRKKTTKGNKGGIAYLAHPELREALARHIVVNRLHSARTNATAPELSGAIFLSKNGTRFSPSSMSRLFSKIYSNAGLEGATSHTGRRSLARNLNRNGVSIYNVQKVLRHANISQTVRYIDIDEELLANIVSTI